MAEDKKATAQLRCGSCSELFWRGWAPKKSTSSNGCRFLSHHRFGLHYFGVDYEAESDKFAGA